MIISHKYKFIFIKTRKTAGTSIEVYLSEHCGDSDVLTEIIPPYPPHKARNNEGFYNHMPATEIRNKVPKDIWANYHKFCVERNPWDKVVSYFHMEKSRKNNHLTFEEYINANDFPVDHGKYSEQSPDGIIVDQVLRYESLNSELAATFASLGLRFEGSLAPRAKSEYRIEKKPYQDYYTDQQATKVADAFKFEIEQFGYRF